MVGSERRRADNSNISKHPSSIRNLSAVLLSHDIAMKNVSLNTATFRLTSDSFQFASCPKFPFPCLRDFECTHCALAHTIFVPKVCKILQRCLVIHSSLHTPMCQPSL